MKKLLLMRRNRPATNRAGELRIPQRPLLCETSSRWCRPFSMPPKPARFSSSHRCASSLPGSALVSRVRCSSWRQSVGRSSRAACATSGKQICSAEHRQEVNGQQRPKGIGLGSRANLLDGVARFGPCLGFDHRQRRLEVLGLQIAVQKQLENLQR